MKLRYVALFALILAALVGAGLFAGKLFPRDGAEVSASGAAPDPAVSAAWRKAAPWLYNPAREDSLRGFRDRLLIPFAVEHGLAPAAARRRQGMPELSFPRGRPVHELAYALEQRAAGAGFRLVEGREIGIAVDQVEYVFADAAGRSFALRLRLGQVVAPGAYRMALIITDLGRASAADIKAWLAFPYPVTLVVPDTLRLGKRGVSRDILVELPMEPAAYPVVKPGPRALFIDHDAATVSRILRGRLDAVPDAAGFATRLGDRAIENRPLMEEILAFTVERRLLFLDLTESPRSLTSSVSLQLGAESYVAAAREAGAEAELAAELDRRSGAAQRSGEGLWVVRHAPGLPQVFARVLRARLRGEAPPRWVTLGTLRGPAD